MMFPWPTAPPKEASRKPVRDGHWSLPSSDFLESPGVKALRILRKMPDNIVAIGLEGGQRSR